MFDKIDNIIRDKKLKSTDCAYHTYRDLDNNGKLRILVVKGENKANVEYICPKCKSYNYQEEEWKRPFQFKCKNCGSTIKVPKLYGKVKKKR